MQDIVVAYWPWLVAAYLVIGFILAVLVKRSSVMDVLSGKTAEDRIDAFRCILIVLSWVGLLVGLLAMGLAWIVYDVFMRVGQLACVSGTRLTQSRSVAPKAQPEVPQITGLDFKKMADEDAKVAEEEDDEG
jgi:hypothetical protein